MEQVDLEFDRVLTERETYVGELSAFEGGQALNTDVLEKVLADEFPPENKLEGENFGKLLDEFIAFGIDNVQSLKKLLKKHRDAIFAAEEAAVKDVREKKGKGHYIYTHDPERFDKGVFYAHTGLARQALREEVGEEEFDEYLKKGMRKA